MSRWRKRKPSSPGNCGRSGRISSCRTSAASRGSTSGSSGASACTAPRWKSSPSTAPRSSTARSCGSSWSSRAARSARSVGGTSTSPSSVASASISVMKSGLPPALSAIRRAQILGQRLSDQRVRLVRRERLEPQRHRPGRAALEQLRPGHAQQQQRRARREQRHRLDQVEERLLAPLQVVEADDERRLLLEQLAERPRDLVRARRPVALAEQRSQRGRGLLVGGQGVELLHDLDDRPVGDPLAVGEAAPADDACLDAVERLRDEARLADAGVADAQSPARRTSCVSARSHACRSACSSGARPTKRDACERSGGSRHREQPERRHRLRLPLQRQRLHRLCHDRLVARAPASAAPINTSPGRPPAPAAPRR